jgi:hypothetical protein
MIKLRRMKWTWNVARMGEKKNALFWWDKQGNIPLGRLRRRWEDNIEMYFREMGGGGCCGLDLSGSD